MLEADHLALSPAVPGRLAPVEVALPLAAAARLLAEAQAAADYTAPLAPSTPRRWLAAPPACTRRAPCARLHELAATAATSLAGVMGNE